MRSDQSRITIDIPEAMHKQFKALCASRGKSMREAFVEFVKTEVSRGGTQECEHSHVPNAQTKKALEKTQKREGLKGAQDIHDLFNKLGI